MTEMVVVFIGVLVGIFATTFLGFCVFLLLEIRKLRSSVDTLVEAVNPLSQSGIGKAAESMNALSVLAPVIVQRLESVAQVVGVFTKALFRQGGEPGRVEPEIELAPPPSADGSSFSAPDEQEMARAAAARSLRRQGIETDASRVPEPPPDRIVSESV